MHHYEPGRTIWEIESFEKKGVSLYGFRDEKDVLDVVKDKDSKIRFIRCFFPDINGMINDFFFPASELEGTFENGKGFDGSSVKGMLRIEESDLVFFPDPTSMRILPFLYEGKTKGLYWRNIISFGTIRYPDGRPFEGDSRYILQKTLEKMGNLGANHFYVGPEMEFFLISDLEDPKPLDHGGYFRGGSYGDLRSEVQILLDTMGVPTEYDHHEVAFSQHEIDFVFDDALKMADKTMLFRYVVKKIARENGIFATFAPKPFPGVNGSGMHTHMSLWKDEQNLFFEAGKNLGFSDFGMKFLGGVLHRLPEIMLATNPFLNSYERLVPGFEAPTMRAVDLGNRSTCIRIPAFVDQNRTKRLELRSPDPSCNIYLALSAMLAAGLDGIMNGAPEPIIVNKNVYQMSAEERDSLGIKAIPGTLGEAIAAARNSEFFKEAIGSHLAEILLANKEDDWSKYLKSRESQTFSENEAKKAQELHEFNILYSRKELLAQA